MSYTILAYDDSKIYNLSRFLVDTASDMKSLPTDCAPGSKAIVAENGSVFLLNNNHEWKKQTFNGGGDSQNDIVEELKKYYIANGGKPTDVENLVITPEIIYAIAKGGILPTVDEDSGDVTYVIREPKTDINFGMNSTWYPLVDEVKVSNINGKGYISGFLYAPRIIIDASITIDNGTFGAMNNQYKYEKQYLYLSDKITSMADYAFSGSKYGWVTIDCGFDENKYPTAMAKAVTGGATVNYNISAPRTIE